MKPNHQVVQSVGSQASFPVTGMGLPVHQAEHHQRTGAGSADISPAHPAAAGSNRKQGRLAPLFIPGRLSGAAPKGGKIFGAELEDECICVDEEDEGTVIADRHHGVVRANEA